MDAAFAPHSMLSKDEARRRFEMVIAWSVDRLGRSLQHRGRSGAGGAAAHQRRVRIIGWLD
jgi:hypothetical protein